ncbi:MAG TPA: EamA family transporter [Terriglobia bacterium]|nr:EamA family transporter [Terriglobia bacterium]
MSSEFLSNRLNARRSGIPLWLVFSLLAVLFFGLWGTISKLVSNEMSPSMYQVAFAVGLLPVLAVVLCPSQLSVRDVQKRGMFLAFVTGILGGTGNMALYKSLDVGGKAAIVVPASSLYSVVTVVLAYLLLKERVSRSQKLGLVLAFVAIYLLSL